MVVVAHDSVRQHIYREHLGQVDKTILNPLPTVIKVFATIMIITAEECAPNAAGSAMVIRCVVETELLTSCDRHVDSVPETVVTITTYRDRSGSNTNYSFSTRSVDLMGVPTLVAPRHQ